MSDLQIRVAENGFIAFETKVNDSKTPAKFWAFESVEPLTRFIEGWGTINKKVEASSVLGSDNAKR